jgi:hypothetical protein
MITFKRLGILVVFTISILGVGVHMVSAESGDHNRQIISGKIISVSNSTIQVSVNRQTTDQVFSVQISDSKISRDSVEETGFIRRNTPRKDRSVHAIPVIGDLVLVIGDNVGGFSIHADRVFISGPGTTKN